MINITFPDGRVAEYEKGVSALDIAKSISEGLARNVLSATVNGETIDAFRPIDTDSTLALHTWNDEAGKETFWHSSAHVLAEAIQVHYPDAKFTIGPPIDNGFYYDIDFGDTVLSSEDLEAIEKTMKKLAKAKNRFNRQEVSKADALSYYQERNNGFKVELINDLTDGDITFYTQGEFTDLCKGPHLPHTGFIKAIKLTAVAGAYWRGSEKNPQLTRVYGITFPKNADLEEYLTMVEEAKKRDHRKLGKELELFAFDDDVGPGMPLWLPRGSILVEELEALAKKVERRAGYQRVRTPHVARESMYLKSGHLPYYKDSMFPPMEVDGNAYFLKSMNCPHHHKIFGAVQRSYKDLPLRLAEYGTCYRFEKSGELFGLMRVRSLQMNDGHIYCTKAQFEEEFKAVNDLYAKYFKLFGIDKYQMRFSTHSPERLGDKYVDAPELWLETENMVREVLVSSGLPFVEIPDEAAFYGPKIDVQVWSAIGREFTLATNQVDFCQAERFDLSFTNQNNELERPLIIHRAPLSTHERFIGFLIEHYAGNFPMWLSPDQIAILPISDKYMDYCRAIEEQLIEVGARCFVDERAEKIGRKIRDAEVKKVPYMFIVGEKEADQSEVSVRKHGEGDQGSMSLESFLKMVEKEISPDI